MKLLPSTPRNRRLRACSGSVMTEACLGLAMMSFTWILMTYSSYMETNHLRTLMAARYASWFAGATFTDDSSSPTEVALTDLDRLFFYQSGLSSIIVTNADGITTVLGSEVTKFFNDANGKGPFKRTVTFGVTDLNAATPFPFDLLKTAVPFMPNSTLTNSCLSVSSTCQWEAVGATWRTPGAAFKGIMDSFLGPLSKVFTP